MKFLNLKTRIGCRFSISITHNGQQLYEGRELLFCRYTYLLLLIKYNLLKL